MKNNYYFASQVKLKRRSLAQKNYIAVKCKTKKSKQSVSFQKWQQKNKNPKAWNIAFFDFVFSRSKSILEDSLFYFIVGRELSCSGFWFEFNSSPACSLFYLSIFIFIFLLFFFVVLRFPQIFLFFSFFKQSTYF